MTSLFRIANFARLTAVAFPVLTMLASCASASSTPTAQVHLECRQASVGVITIVYGSGTRAAGLSVSGETVTIAATSAARFSGLSKAQAQSLNPTLVTEFDQIGAQSDPSDAERVAASYEWSCQTSPETSP